MRKAIIFNKLSGKKKKAFLKLFYLFLGGKKSEFDLCKIAGYNQYNV